MPLDTQIAFVWTVRDGKLVRNEVFTKSAGSPRAAGLQERRCRWETNEIVRRGVEALAGRDSETLDVFAREHLAPDFELESVLTGRVYRGADGVQDFTNDLWETLGYVPAIEEFIDLGEQVGVLRGTRHVTRGGVAASSQLALSSGPSKGRRSSEPCSFASRAEALQSAGLRSSESREKRSEGKVSTRVPGRVAIQGPPRVPRQGARGGCANCEPWASVLNSGAGTRSCSPSKTPRSIATRARSSTAFGRTFGRARPSRSRSASGRPPPIGPGSCPHRPAVPMKPTRPTTSPVPGGDTSGDVAEGHRPDQGDVRGVPRR